MKMFLLLMVLANAALATPAEVRKALADRALSPAISGSVRATAFIIDHSLEAKRGLPEGPLLSYRPLSTNEVALTPNQVTQLLTILSDRRTYIPDMIKLCVPSYELGVTLVSTHGYTEALFCLSCDMTEITTDGGKQFFRADIYRSHNALLDLFRDLFPQSQALRLIKPNKPDESFSAQKAIEWAEMCIPNDPLLKRVKAMKPEELTDEIIEELATKATATQRGSNRKQPKRNSK